MNLWYKNINKSKLTPPSWVFRIVWPVLYTLMFLALFYVWGNNKCFPYCDAVTYFFIQLFFNLIWTTLFFYYKKPKWALLDILFIIVFSIITYQKFYKINQFAGKLLLPYIFWLGFALYLNLYIVAYN